LKYTQNLQQNLMLIFYMVSVCFSLQSDYVLCIHSVVMCYGEAWMCICPVFSLNAMVSPNANYIGLKLNLLSQCKWKLQSLGWLICYVAACYYWYLSQNIVILTMNRDLQCWVLDLLSCHLVNEPNNIDSGFWFIFQLMRVLSLSALYVLSLSNLLFLDLCLRLRFWFTYMSLICLSVSVADLQFRSYA